jgi:ankyrin repeat protein
MSGLHFACLGGNLDKVIFLLRLGADLELQNNLKRRAIHLAALRGHLMILNYLILNKCDLNSQDNEFNTALHLATENMHLDCVYHLLKSQASYELRNHQNLRAYEISPSLSVKKIFEKFDIPLNDGNAVQRRNYIDKVLNLNKRGF